MKDKVIKLQNGVECYIIDEFLKNGIMYILAAQVDNEKGEAMDKYLFLKTTIEDGSMFVEDIKDEAEYKEISSQMLERLEKRNKEQGLD